MKGLLTPNEAREEHNKKYDTNLKPLTGDDVFAFFEQKDKEVVTALCEAVKALDNWLHTYASEHCDKDRVNEAKKEIRKRGGTIAYIADVRAMCIKALNKKRIK